MRGEEPHLLFEDGANQVGDHRRGNRADCVLDPNRRFHAVQVVGAPAFMRGEERFSAP